MLLTLTRKRVLQSDQKLWLSWTLHFSKIENILLLQKCWRCWKLFREFLTGLNEFVSRSLYNMLRILQMLDLRGILLKIYIELLNKFRESVLSFSFQSKTVWIHLINLSYLQYLSHQFLYLMLKHNQTQILKVKKRKGSTILDENIKLVALQENFL